MNKNITAVNVTLVNDVKPCHYFDKDCTIKQVAELRYNDITVVVGLTTSICGTDGSSLMELISESVNGDVAKLQSTAAVYLMSPMADYNAVTNEFMILIPDMKYLNEEYLPIMCHELGHIVLDSDALTSTTEIIDNHEMELRADNFAMDIVGGKSMYECILGSIHDLINLAKQGGQELTVDAFNVNYRLDNMLARC